MSDANLSVISKAVAFSDLSATANPRLRHFDWTRTVENVPVENPKSFPLTIEPNEEATIFSGVRSTSIDGTTAFTITWRAATSTYRMTRSAGTLPAFRTDRALALNGLAVTMLVNSNATMSVTIPIAGTFAGVVAGDTVFIPGLSTGDTASPFNVLNEGVWVVLSYISAQSLVLVRPSDMDFSGESETATLTASAQFVAYSAAGVLVDDTMDLLAGFAISSRRSYVISAVTPSWVEFTSTIPLALEAGIVPGVAGIAFYSAAVRFLRIESDRECAVRMNGDTSSVCRVSPIVAGDAASVGWLDKFGSVWSLKIINLSAFRANVLVMSAE